MRQIPIYWINLASRPDRRVFMEEQFTRLELTAERIEAVTPMDIDPDELQKYSDAESYEWLSPPELACSLSHVKAMRQLLENGHSHAVIFEDDVIVSSKLPAFLDAFAIAPSHFDLIKIEAVREPLRLLGHEGGIGPVELRRPYSWSAGAAGYVISARAARIVSESEEIRRTATDCAMFNPFEPLASKLTMRFAYPSLCVQEQPNGRAGESSLTPARLKKPNPVKPAKRALFWARRIIDREVRIGALKAWHQFARGARKQSIPFLP